MNQTWELSQPQQRAVNLPLAILTATFPTFSFHVSSAEEKEWRMIPTLGLDPANRNESLHVCISSLTCCIEQKDLDVLLAAERQKLITDPKHLSLGVLSCFCLHYLCAFRFQSLQFLCVCDNSVVLNERGCHRLHQRRGNRKHRLDILVLLVDWSFLVASSTAVK